MTKQCQNCKATFEITDDDMRFYERIKVPPPTFCPECRAVRRMVFWNEHFLFRKKEAVEQKEVFSTYPEEAKVKIYDHDYWWSDKWDSMTYGRKVDFSKPFLQQFQELISEMPWPSRSVRGLVNSDYCNQCSYLKNCYLCFNCKNGEDCLYAVGFQHMKNSMDFYWSIKSELCYELIMCSQLYQSFFTTHSSNGRNLWFCYKCDDCNDCFGSINLRHKQYHIFNQPYSKEEYFKKLKEFNLGSYQSLSALKEQVKKHWLKYPYKYTHARHNVNVIGDYVYGSKNCKYVFQGGNMENVRYSQNMGFNTKDSYDYTNWGEGSELIYESVSVGDQCKGIKFCFDCWPGCQDLEYCISCHSSVDLLGCFGLKKKQYCILNKQYSKEEYFALREKIIKHMEEMPYLSDVRSQMSDVRKIEYRYGEFFPPQFSPLAYNETVANDYFPISKKSAQAQGFLWHEPHQKEFQITVPADKLADHISDAPATITKEVISCQQCKKAYRILDRELKFYQRSELPLPRLCPNCRVLERSKMLNPLKWHKRQCLCQGKTNNQQQITDNRYTNTSEHFHGDSRCPNEFETSYAPERPEIIYCETCYQAEVV